MFFDNFWILDWEIFEGETVRLREAMQLYEAVMEGKKIDRLGFGLGDFWREGVKFFFSTKN